MKTFRDLQVGDLIFEANRHNNVSRISKITKIRHFQSMYSAETYFYLDIVLGDSFPAVTCVPDRDLNNTISKHISWSVFANESDFLKAIENENF